MYVHTTSTTDPETQRKIDTLTDKAFEILMYNLGSYGNQPNRAHQDALREILNLFSRIALGTESGRHAVPLATGAGKTQSIVAFITAVHQLRYEDISLAVCASQVEALCELKRAMYWQGVPDEMVGLWHSYAFDEEMAQKYITGDRQDLDQGYASYPCTEDHTSKQVLLVTHNRLRGKGSVKQYNTYRGKPRRLTIWDESLFLSNCFAIEVSDLKGATSWIKMKQETKYEPLIKYLRESLTVLDDKTTHQVEAEDPKLCTLPSLTTEQLESFQAVLPRGTHGEVIGTFLDMSRYPIRIFRGPKKALIAYTPVIDEELKDIVILDASNSIRKLCDINNRITRHDVRTKGVVSYEDVTINQLFYPSGRNKAEKYTAELARTDKGVFKEVIQVIKDTPEDEAILVVTFKQQPRGQDHIGTLKRSLRDNNVNPDAKITYREWGCERDKKILKEISKPRINFLSWGNECGWNHLSRCTTVILAGILHRREDDLASYVAGERDDPLTELELEEIREIRTSEVCHCIYQALSRGSCRVIKNGKAGAMTVWMIHKGKDIRETLNEVMPGVKWKEWTPVYLNPETREDKIAQTISDYLHGLPPEATYVSTKSLKSDLPLLSDTPSTSLTRAVKKAAERAGWVYVRGSLRRDLRSQG